MFSTYKVLILELKKQFSNNVKELGIPLRTAWPGNVKQLNQIETWKIDLFTVNYPQNTMTNVL